MCFPKNTSASRREEAPQDEESDQDVCASPRGPRARLCTHCAASSRSLYTSTCAHPRPESRPASSAIYILSPDVRVSVLASPSRSATRMWTHDIPARSHIYLPAYIPPATKPSAQLTSRDRDRECLRTQGNFSHPRPSNPSTTQAHVCHPGEKERRKSP